MLWNRKPVLNQADQIKVNAKKKLSKIRVAGEKAARTDHAFAAVGIVVVACAAILGMSFSGIMALASGKVEAGVLFQLGTIFAAVIIMNKAQSSAARKIRWLQSRGEDVSWQDYIACYGVLSAEALSFAYAIWLIESPQNIVQWILLVVRSVLFVYTIMWLEMEREHAIDTRDMVTETEIGQGFALLDNLVERAFDDDVPLALRMQSYQATANLDEQMERKLTRMVAAAQAQDEYKASGKIVLIDTHGDPLQAPKKTVVEEGVRISGEADVERPKARGNGAIKLLQRVAPKKKSSAKKSPEMSDEDRLTEIVQRIKTGEEMSVRTVEKLFGVSHYTAQSDMRAAKKMIATPTGKAGPVALNNTLPPAPVDMADAPAIGEV